MPCGPLVANAGVPNSTLVPCRKETLCEFERPPRPVPFPLQKHGQSHYDPMAGTCENGNKYLSYIRSKNKIFSMELVEEVPPAQ
jgi:hypothetical protein